MLFQRASFLAVWLSALVSAEVGLDIYRCSLCLSVAEEAISTGRNVNDACPNVFPADVCKELTLKGRVDGNDARQWCEAVGMCHSQTEAWRRTSSSNLDIRISKAYGSKGYDKLRVSVISNATIESDLFTYSAPFQYRWTDKVLNTGIISVTPGETTSIEIAGETFDIYVPSPTESVRGVIIADPCFMNDYVYCKYDTEFDMFNHSTALFNAINAHDDVQYWSILGDNFYDQSGEGTAMWFNALSKESKTKIFSSTPGNHDFWVNGGPRLRVKKDQLGNGFMQYYGQDVAASVESSEPYDFSVNPDAEDATAFSIPSAKNYFFYNQVGNTAFIGFSGAHSFDEMTPMFEEACTWAAAANPDVILLLGHWNHIGLGCSEGSTVPQAYDNIASLEACKAIVPKLQYVMGHEHCNMVTEPDLGYMVRKMCLIFFDYFL